MPAAYSVQRLRHVAGLTEKGTLPGSVQEVFRSAPPRSVPDSSSNFNLWKKRASACSCDHAGSHAELSGSGAKAGIVFAMTAPFCFMASLQEGQTARC